MTEDSDARELLAEVNRIHARYTRRQLIKGVARTAWVSLAYGIVIAMLGNLLGDAAQRHDVWHSIVSSIALVLILPLYYKTCFRR